MNRSRLLGLSRVANPSLLCATLLSSGLLAACSAQKDPSPGLGGGETSSGDPTSEQTESKPSTSDNGATTDTATATPPASSSDGAETTGPGTTTDNSAASGTGSSGGSSEPPATTTDETTSPPSVADSICPIVEGATWTYAHSTGWSETQTVTIGEYEGQATFIVSDTPDPDDSLRADSYHVKQDGKLLRIYKEQYWVNPDNQEELLDASTTYGVGFLRCDEAWASHEAGWTETPEYVRVETVAGQAPKAPEDRKHTFTVEGRESITTSEGKTFDDCVKVRRGKDWAATTGDDVEEKLYWFCPGVGKVREENVTSGKFEELTDYTIPQ